MRDVAPTRSAAIALSEERQLMRQGFGFIEEKRMLLAAEILRQLRLYEAARNELEGLRLIAAEALARAVERHGLEALQAYPVPAAPPQPPAVTSGRFLGVPQLQGEPWILRPAMTPSAIDPSPEAEICRAAFERLLEATAGIGILAANLEALALEYRRVERRAKALENVLIPEVEATLKQVGEQLDILDQEEAVRVHQAARDR